MSRRGQVILRTLGAIVSAVVVICAVIFLWPAPRVMEPRGSPSQEGKSQQGQSQPGPSHAGSSQADASDLVVRGKYMATAADCVACHTAQGGVPFAGGRPFKLPFGTIYAPNITPDRETGIGAWSDGEFLRAMHKGVGREGEQLYPAFPYTAYAMLTEEDVLAIKAYLFSLSPVRQSAPPNELGFPFNQRRFVRFWNLLFAREQPLVANRSQPPEWTRGAYLVRAAGHCGECHTPRNVLYGVTGKPLSGETMQGWSAWNITSDPEHGIGNWSVDELVHYLREGFAPGRAVASGPMREAVVHSLSKLTDKDLRAIAVYLKSVPAVAAGPVPQKAPISQATASQKNSDASAIPDRETLGRRVFDGACASCHSLSGDGQQTQLAALHGLRSVADPAGVNVMQIILRGEPPLSSAQEAFMPAFGAAYSDEEVAAVTSFVLAHFGGQREPVTVADVRGVAN